jgi:hypothetical protein
MVDSYLASVRPGVQTPVTQKKKKKKKECYTKEDCFFWVLLFVGRRQLRKRWSEENREGLVV